MLVTVVIILITILFISIIIDFNMELQEIYILVFGLMFQTVSLFVSRDERFLIEKRLLDEANNDDFLGDEFVDSLDQFKYRTKVMLHANFCLRMSHKKQVSSQVLIN